MSHQKDLSVIGYVTAHNRVRRAWGAASDHSCCSCGDAAKEWAYDGADPEERVHLAEGKYPVRFSVWPEFYIPLCYPCHRRRDRSAWAARRTHFGCGHEKSVANTYTPPGKGDECRTCRSKRSAEAYQHRKNNERKSIA